MFHRSRFVLLAFLLVTLYGPLRPLAAADDRAAGIVEDVLLPTSETAPFVRIESAVAFCANDLDRVPSGAGSMEADYYGNNECSDEAIDEAFESLKQTCKRPHRSNFYLVCDSDGNTSVLWIVCDIW